MPATNSISHRIIHFALFARACFEVDHRNKARQARNAIAEALQKMGRKIQTTTATTFPPFSPELSGMQEVFFPAVLELYCDRTWGQGMSRGSRCRIELMGDRAICYEIDSGWQPEMAGDEHYPAELPASEHFEGHRRVFEFRICTQMRSTCTSIAETPVSKYGPMNRRNSL